MNGRRLCPAEPGSPGERNRPIAEDFPTTFSMIQIVILSSRTSRRGLATRSAVHVELCGRSVQVRGDGDGGDAATSAASQLGSSVGAAVLNIIAVAVTASYLIAHHTAAVVTATVHGFTVAMLWGAIVMVAAAAPIALFVARTPSRSR